MNELLGFVVFTMKENWGLGPEITDEITTLENFMRFVITDQ